LAEEASCSIKRGKKKGEKEEETSLVKSTTPNSIADLETSKKGEKGRI